MKFLAIVALLLPGLFACGVSKKDITLTETLQKINNLGYQVGNAKWMLVDVSEQNITLFEGTNQLIQWPVSTALAGIGNKSGSNQTPLGLHRVVQKCGDGSKVGAIFRFGQDTGNVSKIYRTPGPTTKDWLTTRVLILEGLEPGVNKGNGIDSFKRGIMVHGTPQEWRIGQPASKGCIRLKNNDVVELYNLINKGTLLYISR